MPPSRRRLEIGFVMAMLVGCASKPKVVKTETRQEAGGMTLVTLTVACNGTTAEKCEGEGLIGITAACPLSPHRAEVKTTKTSETIELQWRCDPPRP